MWKQPHKYKFILTNTNTRSWICRQVRRCFFVWVPLPCGSMAIQWWALVTQKITKDQKGRKTRSTGWEDTNLVSLFDFPNFNLYCDHKIAAICTSDYIYKLRHRIIQSFGSEGTPIGIFIYSTAAFQHKCLFTAPEMVSSHRWRTIAL